MICSNCYYNILTNFICKICQNNFCSLSCLQIHCYIEHTTINNKRDSQNKKIINSPLLVKGTIDNTIEYNEIYSLKNFEGIKKKVLGTGSYGQVFLGFNKITKKYYAIKHMDKKNILSLLKTLKIAQKEIEIQSKINHPNLVKLLYAKETEKSYYLVMDYATGGSLFSHISKHKGLSEDETFSKFIQVLNAINFLHENDLIHRDIKPENILIFENNVVKICDFGWCVKLNGHQRRTYCGTTEYMSPELVNYKEYGKENDVWSLGILLYEMIHGYSPFRSNKPVYDEKDVINNIINHNLRFEKEISNECKQLICDLLEPNINKRIKVEDIYNSAFIKKYEKIKYGLQNNNQIQFENNNQIKDLGYNKNINYNKYMVKDLNIHDHSCNIIKFPDKNGLNLTDNFIRNKSSPKVRKINDNNMNSTFNNDNYYSNIISNNNNNFIIDNKDDFFLQIDNNLEKNINKKNDFYIDNNNVKQKGISNKTCENFYPNNIQKKRENEIIGKYSIHTNDPSPEKVKRDNIEFINFNNYNFYLYHQNNFSNITPEINMNYINNNKNNNNMQIKDGQYISMDVQKLEEKKKTNQIINDNIINYDYLKSTVNNNINGNYYNYNGYNHERSKNIFFYPNEKQSSLIGNPTNINNNKDYNKINNSGENYIKENNNISIIKHHKSPIKNRTEKKKTFDNSNYMNCVTDSKTPKINEFKLEDNYCVNVNITKNIKNTAQILHPDKYTPAFSNEIETKRYLEEKEPLDNMKRKYKEKISDGEILFDEMNAPKNNDKYEPINNSNKNKIEKCVSILSEDKLEKIKNKNEQTKECILNRSKSFCGKSKVNNKKNKKNKLIIIKQNNIINSTNVKIYDQRNNISKKNDYSQEKKVINEINNSQKINKGINKQTNDNIQYNYHTPKKNENVEIINYKEKRSRRSGTSSRGRTDPRRGC